jgi:hypothetical protein
MNTATKKGYNMISDSEITAEDGTNKLRVAQYWASDIAHELANLSYAFEQTGNVAMASSLDKIAERCDEITNLIASGLADNTKIMMQRATESSHNMLMAAIAIAGVGKVTQQDT